MLSYLVTVLKTSVPKEKREKNEGKKRRKVFSIEAYFGWGRNWVHWCWKCALVKRMMSENHMTETQS